MSDEIGLIGDFQLLGLKDACKAQLGAESGILGISRKFMVWDVWFRSAAGTRSIQRSLSESAAWSRYNDLKQSFSIE